MAYCYESLAASLSQLRFQHARIFDRLLDGYVRRPGAGDVTYFDLREGNIDVYWNSNLTLPLVRDVVAPHIHQSLSGLFNHKYPLRSPDDHIRICQFAVSIIGIRHLHRS